ncbi:type VII secretion protein EccB [Corynebacterium sp. NML 120412]|uniref:type VII secretion protein EccB n=1 Tax=Corynebacterium sp. NML 120412 TaxID=2029401 RepID=UPI00210128E8|nr:type VII secretion protein EccB [Corynebacterium sp. NML 120412]
MLAEDTALLAEADGREWLVTRDGRTQLPPPATPEGRVIRRGLGIDATTPRWRPPAPVLGALREHPPFALPNPLPRVVRTGTSDWAETSRGVQEITSAQAQMLIDAGAIPSELTPQAVADRPDAEPPVDIRLPARLVRFLDPAGDAADAADGALATCATEGGGAAHLPASEALEGSVLLSGEGPATRFAGLPSGAVAVDTGHGYHVVDQTGLRYEAPDAGTLETVGVARTEQVPWSIVQLLPAGERLTREAALTATY